MTSPSPTDALAALTLELMRIPSPSGEERAIADFVERRLRGLGGAVRVRRHGEALVASTGPRDDEPGIVLAGHLDTVPRAGHPEPALAGDTIHGLGASDMKGALAVMLSVLEAIAGAAARPATFVFYDCEETVFAKNGLRRVLAAEPSLARAEAALLLEPTANALELGCLGTLSARVTFHGAAAHTARPWLGENAIHKGGEFLAALARRPVREVADGPAIYREVMSAVLAEGGTARNVVPDRFAVTVNFRFAPDRTAAGAEAFLREELPSGTEVEILDAAPAAPARMDAPAFRELMNRFALEARAKQAWTDAAQFAALGVPAANFGPGLPELAHRRDESVPTANLLASRRMLLEFLERPGERPRGANREG